MNDIQYERREREFFKVNADLEDVLASIENLIETHQCGQVVIVRDLNTDDKRNNGRLNRLKTFLCENYLESSWTRYNVNFTHEFERIVLPIHINP